MARRKFSQAEAWSLFHKERLLRQLIEAQRSSWSREFPGGQVIGSISSMSPSMVASIHTARLLGHAVVVAEYNGNVTFNALPLDRIEP